MSSTDYSALQALFTKYTYNTTGRSVEFSFELTAGFCSLALSFEKSLQIIYDDYQPVDLNNPDLERKVSVTLDLSILSQQYKHHFFLDWDDLLVNPSRKTQHLSHFYIIENDLLFDSSNIDDVSDSRLQNYLSITQAIQCLKNASDYISTEYAEEQLIFLHKLKLAIRLVYPNEQTDFAVDGISHFSALLNDEAHKEQKISILKSALYELLSSVPEVERLEYLLKHFGRFSTKVSEDYNLFVSEFSFDEVREEYREQKRDYVLKINDSLSNLYTKALGIPVSIAVVGFKFSSLPDATVQTNIALSIAVFFYGIMMLMLVFNQKDSLMAIKSEYRQQMRRLNDAYPQHHNDIKEEFSGLDKRIRSQKRFLMFFGLSSLLLIIAPILYWLSFVSWLALLGHGA